jgi:hypothetical protein
MNSRRQRGKHREGQREIVKGGYREKEGAALEFKISKNSATNLEKKFKYGSGIHMGLIHEKTRD